MEVGLSRAGWHTSTRGNGSGGACVEAATNRTGIIAIRGSKDPHGPALVVSRSEWASFSTRIRSTT